MTSVLSAAVNNPQNGESCKKTQSFVDLPTQLIVVVLFAVFCGFSSFADENQRMCAGSFPLAFQLMQNYPVLEVVRPIANVICLAVANNGETLQRIQDVENSLSVFKFVHKKSFLPFQSTINSGL